MVKVLSYLIFKLNEFLNEIVLMYGVNLFVILKIFILNGWFMDMKWWFFIIIFCG